jgi:hypothetical protein
MMIKMPRLRTAKPDLQTQTEMQRTWEGYFEKLIGYTSKLPELSLDGENAKLLIKVYLQSDHYHHHGDIKGIGVCELFSRDAVDKTPINQMPHLEKALDALVCMGLLTYWRDAVEVYIRLKPLGIKVGSRLYEQRSAAIEKRIRGNVGVVDFVE